MKLIVLPLAGFGMGVAALGLATWNLYSLPKRPLPETCIPFYFTPPSVPITTEVEVCLYNVPPDFSIFDVSVSPEPDGRWRVTGLKTTGGTFTITERSDLAPTNFNTGINQAMCISEDKTVAWTPVNGECRKEDEPKR